MKRITARVLAALAVCAWPANARTFVVDQAGGGDFTTIQAALDQGYAYPWADTVLVHAGAYPETLDFYAGNNSLLLGTAGAESTSFLAFGSADNWTVRGMTLQGPLGAQHDNVDWRQCRFVSAVGASGFGWSPTFEDCDFFAPTTLNSYTGHMRALRFHQAPLKVYVNGGGDLVFDDAVFEGAPTDTLVWVDASNNLSFERCQFSTGAVGVCAARPLNLSFNLCAFADLGIGIYGPNLIASLPAQFSRLTLDSCQFARCAQAAVAHFNRNSATGEGRFDMTNSTVTGCSGVAVSVTEAPLVYGATRLGMDNVRFELGGATAVSATVGQATIQNCAFFANEGAGASLTFTSTAKSNSITRNTFAFNLGDGLTLAGLAGTLPADLTVSRNLSAQNGGAGFHYGAPAAGTFTNNDAWQNYGPDYTGFVPDASNLALDPLFCDLMNGVLTVSATSPCATGTPTGPIGAYGVGCDQELAGTPPLAGAAGLAVRPNPARGSVEFALPVRAGAGAVEVLDVQGRRVWSTPVAAGASAVRWQGEREAGGRAGAGIYWVRAASGGAPAQTKRFVWLE